MAKPNEFTFSVASELLRELGERLVGRPSVALGELVKNAYDADAYHVEITLEPRRPKARFEGRIVVRDSGFGMTRDEFESYWMRIGDGRKARERYSPYLRRPYAGSKGVGRIAAQFLSHRMRIETVSVRSPRQKFVGWLDWREAIAKGDLEEVVVKFREEAAGPSDFVGTSIILEELKQDWVKEEVVRLAADIWTLEPPYRKREPTGSVDWNKIPPLPPERAVDKEPIQGPDATVRRAEDFLVTFSSPFEEAVQEFEKQQRQVMDLWAARITGGIERGKPKVAIQWRGEEPRTYDFPRLRGKGDSIVGHASFEILVYDVKGRQPGIVPVGTIREYLEEHGGVQIFDHGFRLPYYGLVQNDWLGITYDHSRRLSKSRLVPETLQVPEGMYYMPTYHQVFGFVEIRTGDEENLHISITRDRLEEGAAFENLRDVIRASLHWYGSLRTERLREDASKRPVRAQGSVAELNDVLRQYKSEIPGAAYKELERTARQTASAVNEAEASVSQQLAALSGYATAGIAAIAYHHEIVHQLSEIEQLAKELEATGAAPSKQQVSALKERILSWATRVRSLRDLFAPYLGDENVKEVRRFRVGPIVEDVLGQMGSLLERVSVDHKVGEDVYLPPATYVEWVSILQNVLFNAINALQDSRHPQIRIHTESGGKGRRVVVENSGARLDLSKQDEMFKPFKRGIAVDPTLGELGYGGSGLGLTIVKMIADRRNCRVGFRAPSKGYSTAFVLQWEEV